VARELLYGRNAVLESLRAGRRNAHRLLLADSLRPDARLDEVRGLAARATLTVDELSRDTLDELVPQNHQGVILEADGFPYASTVIPETPAPTSILLALDELEDPRNVGALMRTAEAVGIDGLVMLERRAAAITPAVVNASSGAVEHLRVARETNLARWIGKAGEAGYWIIGLDGSPDALDLFDADLPLPAVVVVGSEGRGLRRLTRDLCDILVRIPMYGRIESLNAAAAGSIALYQLREYAS
jgi:23S rRNA (guanosine2251-2'-O)-methyltransferase